MIRNPIVLVGMLAPEEREAAVQLLLKWQVPVYLEATSCLRWDRRLQDLRIYISDGMIERARKWDYPVDGVIRLGGIPTLRLWRDLEEKFRDLPVLSLSRLPFSGLSRPSVVQAWGGEVAEVAEVCVDQSFTAWLAEEWRMAARLSELLNEEPRSEPGLIAALERCIPQGARVYLGNSLPIREWDLVSDLPGKFSGLQNQESQARGGVREVWASRGLNGIDGQVSTFLGFAEEGASNWGIFGDLTALYDLPAPWALSQRPSISAHLVVINNGGGKIFSKMFPYKEFQNQHQIRFQAWAQLWNLKYECWNNVPDEHSFGAGSNNGYGNSGALQRVIEILPDEAATARFWEKYRKI